MGPAIICVACGLVAVTIFVGEDVAFQIARGWYNGRCAAGACHDGCPCEGEEEEPSC